MASVMAMRLLGLEINAPHHGKYLGGWANRVLGQPSGATDKAAWMDECRKVLAEATQASEWVLFGNPEWFEGAKTTEGADIEQGDNTVLNRAHAPTERIYFLQERETIGHTYAVKAENWEQALEKFEDHEYEEGEPLQDSYECLHSLSPKKVGMAVVRPCINALKEQVISEDTGLLITRPKVKLVRPRHQSPNVWHRWHTTHVCYNEICMTEEEAKKNWGPDRWGYQESYVDESGVCRECREKEAKGFISVPYNTYEDDYPAEWNTPKPDEISNEADGLVMRGEIICKDCKEAWDEQPADGGFHAEEMDSKDFREAANEIAWGDMTDREPFDDSETIDQLHRYSQQAYAFEELSTLLRRQIYEQGEPCYCNDNDPDFTCYTCDILEIIDNKDYEDVVGFAAVGAVGLLPALLDPTMATLALTALVGAVMLSKAGGDDDAHWEKLHDEHPERFDEHGHYIHP